jgi:hypothetical protein
MFNWLKSRDRQIADKVLALLAHAIKEVHPNRFIDPSEAGMVAQSKLSQLNLLLGKGRHDIHGRAMRDKVRQRAKQLLGYVNPQSQPALRPASRA